MLLRRNGLTEHRAIMPANFTKTRRKNGGVLAQKGKIGMLDIVKKGREKGGRERERGQNLCRRRGCGGGKWQDRAPPAKLSDPPRSEPQQTGEI